MMKNKKRIVHVQIIDGSTEQIKTMSIVLGEMKKKMPEYEFIITNGNVKLVDLGQLIKSLYDLYKKNNKGSKDEKK